MWCQHNVHPTGVEMVLWLCKWLDVIVQVRSGCPSTSHMFINDIEELVLADKRVLLKNSCHKPVFGMCL